MLRVVALSLVLVFTTTACAAEKTDAETPGTYDLVIYGPTSAGIAAAVQAKRMELSVVIVGPDKHLGGLSAGGLGWTDSGKKHVIGGISREYYQRIKKVYDDKATWKWQDPSKYSRYRTNDDAQWTFEPSIAERVFEDLVREYKIDVRREQWLDRSDKGVTKKGGRITAITTLSGKTYRGKMFIDATYEGDLMATAGVSYTVGREAIAKYDETLNGVQKGRRSHQFHNKISPYKTPGDPSSGLLPRVHADDPGENGQGDHRIQAYNFRMCLTRVPENRVAFAKPEGYDAGQYELLLRDLLAGSRHIKGKFDMLPNMKTDTNNHGSFSTDNIGMNYDYPDASYERRAAIIKEHEVYQKGYLYFLANDPRVPEDVRKWYGEWGLAKDEFVDNGHWPHQIYVREARRMVGDVVVHENHLKRKIPTPRSVGMGSYNMDSHNTQRYIDADGWVRNEGDVQVNPGGPYPIDYGAIAPKKSECENLLVVCAVSSSHIAYGSIRMEPVFMILGQSATTAIAQALEADIAVQDVDYDKLAARLIADGQVLEDDSKRSKPNTSIDTKTLKGIVFDDERAKRTGKWTASTSKGPFVHGGYRHAHPDNGVATATYAVSVDRDGLYEIRLAYSADPNRASNVSVTIDTGGKKTAKRIDQRKAGPIDGAFVSLGRYELKAGKTSTVTITNEGADGYVIADAVVVVKAE